jgi:GTP cyclohydrolase III
MSKYLYGASVQGIQEFIFATNKLQEIVGASEIVKSIEKLFEESFKPNEIVLNAAGNIKAVFESFDECQKAVLNFPKMVMQNAFGITISQAVVKFDGEAKDYINELEIKLKVQRNKPSIPLDSSINIMKLNPTTAKPMVEFEKDKATQQKLKAYNDIENKENTDLHKLSNSKNKIAVIHIDGNGLGELIPKLTMPLSEFSKKLDSATKEAFKKAKEHKNLREIILGGDDVTVIANANDALSFTKEFLKNFEETTKDLGNLTACAGIAFSNEKYPFHYAVALAEELCSATKKHAKKLVEGTDKKAPSSLMFHNIHSSNFQSWDKFIKDELTIKNDKQEIRCDFGPYYLDEPNQPQIDKFQISVDAYRCDGSPISRLRNWMSELYKSDESSNNLLSRINEVTEQNGKWKSCIMDKNLKNIDQELSSEKLIVKKDGLNKTPIYDILQILSTTDPKGAN